jgi:D-alanine-D-alanine ligase-like ATP-grasp enzyme
MDLADLWESRFLPMVSKFFLEFSKKNFDKIIFDDEYWYAGQIIYKNWKKAFFDDTSFDINPFWASRITKDKGYTKTFLSKFWYRVPNWEVFFNDETNLKLKNKKTIDDGFLYSKTLKKPFIIKPNNLSQWKLVWKIFTKKEYYSLAKKILKTTNCMVIEEFCEWNDYRIVVLDDEVMLCYERTCLKILWDGKKTIQELIDDKNSELISKWSNSRINVDISMIKGNLKRFWYKLWTILPIWIKLQLLDNANLSTWWELIDHIDNIHESYKKLAVNIAKDMWLRYSWIDILTQDITKPIWDYNIIEINSSPWFTNYLLAWDKNRELAKNLCEKIYFKMGE